LAEGVGFEPTDGLPHLLISRAVLKPQIIVVSLYFCNLVLFWCYRCGAKTAPRSALLSRFSQRRRSRLSRCASTLASVSER